MTTARFALAALCALAPMLHAQGPERAVFLVRQGADTLAVENASRNGAQVEGALVMRAPVLRIGQRITLGDSARVERVATAMRIGAVGDSVQQRAELVFRGDSAFSHVEDIRAAAPAPDRRFAIVPGSIPFLNLSGLSIELLLRRARALGGDTVRVPVLLLTGQSLTATVSRVGADSALVTLGSAVLHVRTDAEGRLLGARVPSQDVVFERLPAESPVAAWSPVRAQSYDAPAGAPYSAEEVTVRTLAGLRLVGTLTMPARRRVV
jgi:hypothetical protein